MLANVRLSRNPSISMLTGAEPKCIEEGIYIDCGFNFENFLQDLSFEAKFPDLDDYSGGGTEEWLGSYGVVDDIDNFKQVYKELIECKHRVFAVGFTEVKKEDQEEYGWRWHKWGGYYGCKDPQCEYLKDEDDSIQSVMTFSIVEITDKVLR